MISVIIPVFNGDRYLREALDSVKMQTYKDIEIICIDDASTDSSSEIIQEYVDKDARFRIIKNSVHMGAACARNKGIDEAQGEYVCFVDADDIIHGEMLNILYESVEKVEAEIAVCESMTFSDSKIYSENTIYRSDEYIDKLCNNTFGVEDCSCWETLDVLLPMPWGKIFSRKFLLVNNISFQNIDNNNDVFFVTKAFGLSEKIVLVSDCRVLYKNREHSTGSRISFHRNPLCAYEAGLKISMEICDGTFQNTKINFLLLNIIRTVLNGFHRSATDKEIEKYLVVLRTNGIDNLLRNIESFIPYADIKLINILIDIKEQHYSTQKEYSSLLINTALEMYFDEHRMKFERIFRESKYSDKKIGLWGLGLVGRNFLKYMETRGMNIDYLGDRQSGTVVCGKNILDTVEMIKHSDYIIVTTKAISKADILNNRDDKGKTYFDITGEIIIEE